MILVNLRKAYWCKLVWQNERTGNFVNEKPEVKTFNGTIPTEGPYVNYSGQGQPLEEVIALRGGWDKYTPFLTVKLPNSNELTFKGEEAVKLFDAYKGIVYAKS